MQHLRLKKRSIHRLGCSSDFPAVLLLDSVRLFLCMIHPLLEGQTRQSEPSAAPVHLLYLACHLQTVYQQREENPFTTRGGVWVGAEERKLQSSSLTDLLKHFPPAIVPSFLDAVLSLLKWAHILF